MAYQDLHWRYVEDIIAANYVATSNALPEPINTQLIRPEDVMAQQALIDAAQAAVSLAATYEPHTDTVDREDDNEGTLIASIIGAVFLTLLVIFALYKWTANSSRGQMQRSQASPQGAKVKPDQSQTTNRILQDSSSNRLVSNLTVNVDNSKT